MYGAGREISFTNIQDITTYPAQTRMISRFSIILSALFLSNHPSISTLSSIYPSIRLISRAPKEVGELPRRVAQLPQRVAQHPGPLRAARQRRLGRRRRRRRLRAGRNEAYAARPCVYVCVCGGGGGFETGRPETGRPPDIECPEAGSASGQMCCIVATVRILCNESGRDELEDPPAVHNQLLTWNSNSFLFPAQLPIHRLSCPDVRFRTFDLRPS